MNIYDVAHVNGDFIEVEADFFERDNDDWAFFRDGEEVLRLAWRDVVAVSKANLHEQRDDQDPQPVWL